MHMASMMESVTGENVTTWPRDIVNKCPELAASLDLEDSSQGQCEDSPIGWLVSSKNRGCGLSSSPRVN